MTSELTFEQPQPPVAPDETILWSDAQIVKPAGKIIAAHHRFARSTAVTADAAFGAPAAPSPQTGETFARRQRDLLQFPINQRARPLPDWRTQAESLSAQRLEQESPVTEQGPPTR